MTPRELYFLLAPMAFGVFMALALTTTFRHSWRYPYKWYSIAMLYLAACSITYMPLFDFVSDPVGSPGVYIAHDILTSLFAPLLMMAFMRLSQTVPRLTFKVVFLIWLPYLLYHFCYHFIPETPFLLYVCYIYIAGSAIWWCRSISFGIKMRLTRIINDEEDLDDQPPASIDIAWMRPYAIFITVCAILRWGVQTFVNVTVSDWIRPQLLLILLLYMPAFLFYEWRHSEKRFFDRIKAEESQPKAAAPREPQEENRNDLRAARSRLHSRAQLPPNAILPNLTAGNTSRAAITSAFSSSETIDEEDLAAAKAHIAQRLSQMEQERLFYLDKEITAAKLAQQLGIGRPTLSAYFHDLGTTFFDYIERLRATHAATLLREKPQTGLDLIAFESGFTSRSNFNRAFSNHFHCSPEDFRRQAQNP